MDTKLANTPSTFEKNTNNCIVLLERNNQDILQLKKQLSSYTCEPKTYSLYEQFTALKERLDHSFAFNLDLIASLQSGKKIVENHIETIAIQLQEFNALKSGVAAYRTQVKST